MRTWTGGPGGTWRGVLAALALVAVGGCAPIGPAPSGEMVGRGEAAPSSRTLNLLTRAEPATLALKAPAGAGGQAPGLSVDSVVRPFNARLDILDAHGNPTPYLAEALPELSTDSWHVFADGRMETSYRLKANITWHDGTPLSAADFVFAWRVYTTPELGLAVTLPQSLMEEVTAPDARTLVVRWRRLYPQASPLG